MSWRTSHRAAALASLLAACHPAPAPAGPLAADDQRQLNEAAASLDANASTANESANP